MRMLVRDLRDHVGSTVSISGWVNTLRLQRKMQFVLVRDHTGVVQVTHARQGAGDGLEAVIEQLTVESAIRVIGRVVDNPVVNLGGLELVAESIEILNKADTPLPIDQHTNLERRLDWRFLDIRQSPAAQLLFTVQTTLEQAWREFAFDNGCTEMHTPKLMGTASESGAEVFKLEYFGGNAFLAQSPQFYKQMAVASGIDRVFEVGPVFRAEPSFTSRHATEFTGLDVELAWIDSFDDVMVFEERMLAHSLARVAEAHGEAIREHFGVTVTVPSLPFPRITMADTQEILRAGGWDPQGLKEDLDAEGERRIGAHIKQQTGHEFVFVTHYPTSVRPFYHMRPSDNQNVTLSFDLIWKGMETTTGAQREHRYEVLLKQAAEKGLSAEPMQHYLNCFRYGCPPHGGLGMGHGRTLMLLLGLDSLREAVFLFRGPNRLAP